ncbi:MAG: hypothetical protein HKN26_05700, partial [Acidimicrobiales bacterium]|nr:hypothetical protein [Acidimicrobiales bacterium]
IVAMLATIAVVSIVGASAGAHTELAIAVPDIGARVGGTVDRIELTFFGPIEDPTVFVETPSDATIEGKIERPAPNGVWLALERPLDETGQHIVRYAATSTDGDRDQQAYAFVYDPTSPPAVFAGPDDDSGGSPLIGVIVAALALGFVLLLFIAMKRRTTSTAT